ncbi:10613_t:CDS:2 [Funneliformis mosseae]|uniref:10613_t:CDS:1 n=1 Tax=Funneliformis mosseae TaxID=27381 RepID=A0A9N9EKG8_FUNMO|nr:10613_t:CDS:2 [Funneliformis mosseae]
MSHTSQTTSSLPTLQNMFKKRISIKKEGDENNYYNFKFVPSDTKEDIHEVISNCFEMDCFSLRDHEGNFITGSYASLERDKTYDIVDRNESKLRNSPTYHDGTNESINSSGSKSIENENAIKEKKRKTQRQNEPADNNPGPSVTNKKKPKPTQQVRACSRCRRIKKRCDRQRPCGRCVKSNFANACEVIKIGYKEQS